jgi:hypothetical protein
MGGRWGDWREVLFAISYRKWEIGHCQFIIRRHSMAKHHLPSIYREYRPWRAILLSIYIGLYCRDCVDWKYAGF